MTNLRFVLASVALFCVAFVGMSFGMPWASKGFSAAVRSTSMTPDAQITPLEQPVIPGAHAERVVPEAPTLRESSHAATPARDNLAQTAIQAANAYVRAPCDKMAKAAFIVAASTYLHANGTAAQAPKDARVHEAIKAAFETGNIGRDEFPSDTVFSGRIVAAPTGKAACANSAALQRR